MPVPQCGEERQGGELVFEIWETVLGVGLGVYAIGGDGADKEEVSCVGDLGGYSDVL